MLQRVAKSDMNPSFGFVSDEGSRNVQLIILYLLKPFVGMMNDSNALIVQTSSFTTTDEIMVKIYL